MELRSRDAHHVIGQSRQMREAYVSYVQTVVKQRSGDVRSVGNLVLHGNVLSVGSRGLRTGLNI